MQNPISRLFNQDPQPIDRLISPAQRFTQQEAAGGIVLLIATVVAITLANSPFDYIFGPVTESHFLVGVPDVIIDKPLHFWINDALMAVFFFVVGLEIKRSLLLGELASVRQAALPIFAAAGGMIVPAAVYLLLNNQGEAARGWAIPMSTDIAFSLGVLALLGSRAPLSLKAFLTAFAIVDDIGAIVVIAVFFTETISWSHLGFAGAMLGLLVALNLFGVRNVIVYMLVSIVIWVSFFESGIHPTISGVLIALTIPLRVRIQPKQFAARARALIDIFERDGSGERRGAFALTTESQHGALEELEELSKQVESPLQRLEHALHPWVAFVIVPLFALANAHVHLQSGFDVIFASPVAWGIILGLVVGKPIGIIIFVWIAVKAGIASLPRQIGWLHIWGAALLGGIGFTMSIFVTGLAFSDADIILQAKAGILVGSVLAGVIGYLILFRSHRIRTA